jgi:hypothetical protein
MDRLLRYHIDGFGPHSRVVRTCWRIAYTLAPLLDELSMDVVVHQGCELVDRWLTRNEDPDFFRFTIVELMLEQLHRRDKDNDEVV